MLGMKIAESRAKLRVLSLQSKDGQTRVDQEMRWLRTELHKPSHRRSETLEQWGLQCLTVSLGKGRHEKFV